MIKRILYGLVEGLIRNIGGPLGIKIRYFYYRKRLAKCGKNIVIDGGVHIESPENIYLGNNIWIDKHVILLGGAPNLKRDLSVKRNKNFHYNLGEIHINDGVHVAPNVVIQGHGGIHIGANSGIASGSKIYSLSHHYKSIKSKTNKRYFFTPMVSNEDQSLICSPVYIGFGCAIGLNSIILPGTIINDFVWIGTGMICSKEYEANHVYYQSSKIDSKRI